MQLKLGQHVLSSDGKDVGAITHLIFDPASEQVRDFVLETGWLMPDDVEIPIGTVIENGGERIRIRYTADEVKDLPRFDESRYTPSPSALADRLAGYPPVGILWPNMYVIPPLGLSAYPLPAPVVDGEMAALSVSEVDEYRRHMDEDNAVISEGDDVFSKDGEKVGVVKSIAFDSATGRATSLTIQQGWLFHSEWELSTDIVGSVDDGRLTLNLDTAELQARIEVKQHTQQSSERSQPFTRK